MNRWIEDTKREAREMIKDGFRDDVIADKFNMSISSVSLLRYEDVFNYAEKIECKLCGKKYKQITQKHLRRKHGINLKEYKNMFPNTSLMTDHRQHAYQSFCHPNKGKTYDEIYGKEEAENKKEKISRKQIGRRSSLLSGTGITGTRRDTKTYARSTYEANIDRIFAFENKKYIDELSSENTRFVLNNGKGDVVTYQPDRIDKEGLFERGAYIEVKGYMYPFDWEKIRLFRSQYKDKKLIVICPDEKYCDINYTSLEEKYKPLIPLWEDTNKNYKTRPDLYRIGYKTPEHIKYLIDNYPEHININIKNHHMNFIAKKCLSFAKTSLGKYPYIESVCLISISDRRPNSLRKSSGEFNYELWQVDTMNGDMFYVSNQSKTNLFYCYEKHKLCELCKFFENNCNMKLTYGIKNEKTHEKIDCKLWESASVHQKNILQKINDILIHKGFADVVSHIILNKEKESRKGSINNYEEWSIFVNFCDCPKYIFTNFNYSTQEYHLKRVN